MGGPYFYMTPAPSCDSSSRAAPLHVLGEGGGGLGFGSLDMGRYMLVYEVGIGWKKKV